MHQQRSFDDLGTPLHQVTFVVIDLETTGGSPQTCAITEVGAVKYRGGELLGTFQTLVNPGVALPPGIVYLTGITEAMVLPAPRIEAVLGALMDFIGNAVVVGHNVRFDLGFLGAACDRHAWPRLDNPVVDTCALARRLVRDEVPNCRLATLAAYFRTAHTPTHRALDDAWSTAELLHSLLERAGCLGVLGLEDLLLLPKVAGHPQLAKLRLTNHLPCKPGVYLFRSGAGEVLYVGKAVDIRRRVRSYFSSDDRKKVGPLLREVATIDHIECSGELEAAVVEVRLIHLHGPRYNQRTKHWRRYAYLKLTLDEPFPRLSIVRTPKPRDECLYLGPLASTRVAQLVVDAIHTAVPLRRCTARPGQTRRDAPCIPAQLGVAACPCAGGTSREEYATIVETVVRGLTADPAGLLDPLASRMWALAAAGRYEEAADVRDRAGALARAIERQRRLDTLRRAGRIALEIRGEGRAVVEGGLLTRAWRLDLPPPESALLEPSRRSEPSRPPDDDDPSRPLPRQVADEMSAISSWIERQASQLRVLSCDGELCCPVSRLPSFETAR